MASGGRAVRSDGIVRWLLAASVLHAAWALVAALSPLAARAPSRVPAPLRGPEPEESIELTLLGEGQGSALPGEVPLRVALVPPTPARARAARSRSVSAARPGAVVAATPAMNGEPASDEPAPTSDTPARDGGPKLSLDQLGIDGNPFLDPSLGSFLDAAAPPFSREELANARLQAALQAPSLDRKAGAITSTARRLVLDDERLVETSAVFNLRIDAAGRVTEVQVLDAARQVAAWQLIAVRLAQALAPAKRDDHERGWELKLRLASSVRLPSGAAPGMRLGVLGQQAAGSGGPGSTSLELSPTSKLDLKEPIDSIGRHLEAPVIAEVMLLKLKGDPTDIGAPARRVVEVAVLSIDPAATR